MECAPTIPVSEPMRAYLSDCIAKHEDLERLSSRPSLVSASIRRPRVRPAPLRTPSPTSSIDELSHVSPLLDDNKSDTPAFFPLRSSLWSLTNDIMRMNSVEAPSVPNSPGSTLSVASSGASGQSSQAHEQAAKVYRQTRRQREERRAKMHAGLCACLEAAAAAAS